MIDIKEIKYDNNLLYKIQIIKIINKIKSYRYSYSIYSQSFLNIFKKLNNNNIIILKLIYKNKEIGISVFNIKDCDITLLHIDEEYRGIGLGKLLIDNIFKYIDKNEVKFSINNDFYNKYHYFYNKYNFKISSEIRWYDKCIELYIN